MADTAFPSQWPPFAAQKIDLDYTSDSQSAPPPGSLRVSTISGDTNNHKNSIPRALVNAVADQSSSSQVKRGNHLLGEACEIMDKLELQTAIEGLDRLDLTTARDKILQ
jgi:hypothetical protein